MQKLKLTCLLFLLTLISNIYSQCTGYIELTTQEEVDSFLVNYPDCIDGLTNQLRINGVDITNIEGLLGVRSIGFLNLTYLSKIKSLHGLDSVRYFGGIAFNANKELTDALALRNVETIENLIFTFNDSIQNLEFLSNVEFINTIDLNENGYLQGIEAKLQSNPPGSTFIRHPSISIRNNEYVNQIDDYLDPAVDTIERISFSRSKNFSFLNLNRFEHISFLQISESSQFSLEGLQGLKSVRSIFISDIDFSEVDSQFKFDSLVFADRLHIRESKNIVTPGLLFQSDFYVGTHISIIDNPNLFSLTPFDWMDIPRIEEDPDFNIPNGIRVHIEDNYLLEMCDNHFICLALNTYPDSVFLEDNSVMCNKLEWVINCDDILPIEEIKNYEIIVHPNPFMELVTISSDTTIDKIFWIDSSGKVIKLPRSGNDTFDTSMLLPGIYLLKIIVDEKMIVKRLVKM